MIAISPQELPRVDEIAVNGPVLGFALAVSLVTGLAAGVVPSVRFSRPDLTAPLRQGGVRSTGGVRANRLRAGLVVAEVALSLVLLTGAGLLGKSFLAILGVESGFDARRVHTFHLSLPDYRYADQRAGLVFADRLLERLEAIPAVEHAGLTRNLPLSGRSMTAPVRVEGVEAEALSGRPQAQVSSVTPDYFRAMGIALRAGRPFSGADDGEVPPVAIVNETFARTYFPGEDPIGKRARTLFGSSEMKTIVGVVADVHHLSPTREVAPKFYQPLAQFPSSSFDLVVRAASGATELVPAVRTAVLQLDPQLPITSITTLDTLLARTVAQPRFYAQMLSVFAALALLLAMVGFYAVMAGSVAERRREIGIRMAVGARMNQVVALVLREGALLTGLGLAIGLGAALLLTRLLEGLLFQVSAVDPLVLAAVTVFLAVVAGLATALPARAAARVDPMLTLRE